jgi:hypothetical protein
MRSAHWRSISCVLLLGVVQLASAAPEKKPPPIPTDKELGFFTGTRDEMLNGVKRVGVMTPWMPYGLNDREDVKKALQALVADYLKKAGMDVVPPESFQASYDRLNREIGGIYDPKTGAIKEEQQRAVYTSARREFVEDQKLEGYVITRIIPARSNFSSPYAFWDRVRERSTGRVAANALSEFLLTDNTHTGTLPAYSLTIQIANAQDQIVFGRIAGVQLSAYYDVQKAKTGNGFLQVPAADLFTDQVRLERAVRVATLPLVMSGTEIVAKSKDPMVDAMLIDMDDLPQPPVGVERTQASPLQAPREEILGSVRRVALGPMGLAGFAMDPETQGRYLELIRAQVQKLGWEVVTAPNAREVFEQELKATEQLYDPYTGVRDDAKVVAARKAVFSGLGVEPAVDAIIWPSLQKTVAPHEFGDAQWDGVSQSGITLGPVKKALWSGSGVVGAGSGSLSAVTLLVRIANAEDKVLYDGRGGVQLLEQLKGSRAETLAAQELFKDTTREEIAVRAALRQLVMSPEEIAAEQNPKKKKK